MKYIEHSDYGFALLITVNPQVKYKTYVILTPG